MAVTPNFIGQIYKDTTTGNLWRANSTTPGDWTLELQNGQISWTPIHQPMVMGFAAWDDPNPLQNITRLQVDESRILSVDIEVATSLIELSCPNVTNVTAGAGIYLYGNTVLDKILFPSLANASYITIDTVPVTQLNLSAMTSCNVLTVQNCPSITILDLHSYVSSPGLLVKIINNPLLSSINLDAFTFPVGGTFNFSANALPDTSVNYILARAVANVGFVGGSLNVGGIGNAAPTGQGLVDKATLITRGVTVTTN